MKIGIGIPHRGEIKVRTALSLIANIVPLGCDSAMLTHYGCFLHWGREMIYDTALKQDCTHLVFVDTDMVFPPGTIRHLVDLKKDIVGIVAYKKIMSPRVACVRLHEGVEMGPDEIPKELFRCDEVGTGIMAIDLERCQAVAPPRFDAGPPIGEPLVGEDLYFCRKARAAGLEVWCDPTIEVKHIGDYEY